MARIKKMSQQLSNMIAAGEVVERPSGIVKELIENSIDANATTIEVQISQGGIGSIRVIDDGIGMDKEDAVLSFEPHATSKIQEEEDLWKISTMGFRGEALASIASVSEVVMKTCNGKEATQVEINYGELQNVKATAIPQGTSIEIKNLFQKVPARFKHLKSPQYEFSLISDIVSKFAIAYPNISFYLSHDAKETFQSNGNNKLLEVLMKVYGKEVAKNAIAIEESELEYKIDGYIIQPSLNRSNKYYMLIYVNQRMIRNYKLQNAILEAYQDYLPKDRYPIVILNIQMDTQLVDVNVHPNKWEIRLSKEKQLEEFITKSILKCLRKEIQVVKPIIKKEETNWEIQTLDFTSTTNKDIQNTDSENIVSIHPAVSTNKEKENLIIQEINKEESYTNIVNIVEDSLQDIEDETLEYVSDEMGKSPISLENNDISQSNIAIADEIKKEKEEVIIDQEIIAQNKPSIFDNMTVIGQYRNSYILVEKEDGLYIIDQHAAQERYHYEQIKAQILSGNTKVQDLLIPITLEVTPQVIANLSFINESFETLKIALEPFGNNSVVIRKLPLWMQTIDEVKFLQDMLDQWLKNQTIQQERLRHLAIATMACHSSIRFHRSLTFEEMKQVIEDLKKCEQPYHCPHGRPTFICISNAQLIKEFLR